MGAEGALPATARSPRGWRRRRGQPRTAFARPPPLGGCARSLCPPRLYRTTATASWRAAERSTPPLRGTTLLNTVTCTPWCAGSWAPPAVPPATSAAGRHHPCPPPCCVGYGPRYPSAYAASQARLPGAWWYRETMPRAQTAPGRRSTPASVRHVSRWSQRPRRCRTCASKRPKVSGRKLAARVELHESSKIQCVIHSSGQIPLAF